ncbi:hypothetical protein MXB_4939, partial [Myxobolus squamalis]
DFINSLQLFYENWVWEEEFLKKISCHYINKLSDNVIKQLCLTRNANLASLCMQSITLSMFDNQIHTFPMVNKNLIAKLNIVRLYEILCSEYMMIPQVPGIIFLLYFLGTKVAASLDCLCRGSDSRCYAFLWSLVTFYDFFITKFKSNGIFNEETGLSFRKNVLERVISAVFRLKMYF